MRSGLPQLRPAFMPLDQSRLDDIQLVPAGQAGVL